MPGPLLRRRLLAAVVAAVAGFACRTPVPELRPLSPDDPRPARWLAAWAEQAEARHGLRGRARLAVDGGGGALRLRARQVIALERPERLRVEVKTPFDQTVAVLVTDAGRYELLRADDHSYQSGAVHPGLLWETAWLDLAPAEAIELLLAAPAPDGTPVPGSARGDREGGVQIELSDAEGRLRRRVRFDAAGRLSWLEAFDAAGAERLWRAEYADYAPVDGVPFPHTLRLETRAGTRAELTLRDVELNPAFPPGLFKLSPPADRAHPGARPPGS